MNSDFVYVRKKFYISMIHFFRKKIVKKKKTLFAVVTVLLSANIETLTT